MKSRPRSILAGTCLLLTLAACGGTSPATGEPGGQVTAYPAPAVEPNVDPDASPYPSPDVGAEQVQPENYPAPSPVP
ncbi:MAG TPA: hypothetical protein VLA19_02865 [Herpetosiphonaceae bacterium]|nr:hypothetical protein [Herpetosiphonaceae bacterium]